MKKEKKGKLRIIPLGGLEQIGMNITAFEYEDSIVVVDCGLAFPEDDMLGIDLVIPDVTYLKDNASKVKGFVITHGHEDHIGALPYVLKVFRMHPHWRSIRLPELSYTPETLRWIIHRCSGTPSISRDLQRSERKACLR